MPPEIDEADGADEDYRFFTPGNMIMLGLLLALGIYLAISFSLWNIIKAALGLSFIIFIHELGHFVAAKWCDVHVTVFSIGFGPAIPGCRYTWGETTYKLAILPLGGYVQMVGQVDGDESNDGSDDDPRSYRRKPVWQRMVIISAGVVMNALLAILCFIYVYQVPGKENSAGVIGMIDSGGPLFVKGPHTGGVLEKMGTIENPTFNDLKNMVVHSTAGEKIDIVTRRPGDKSSFAIAIEPRKSRAI